MFYSGSCDTASECCLDESKFPTAGIQNYMIERWYGSNWTVACSTITLKGIAIFANPFVLVSRVQVILQNPVR